MNIPTDTLIDMLYIILAGEVAISASDAREIEQIQRELQRRGDEQCWPSNCQLRNACNQFLGGALTQTKADTCWAPKWQKSTKTSKEGKNDPVNRN